MASFKKVETTIVDAKYEGRIKVYLESAEDVRIFSEHWFSDKQDKLRFVSAEGEQSGGGGCQVVISKVEEANKQNIQAYGIVDRDVLLSDKKLDIFWETNDPKFHAAKPYGEKIHVLRRWELENYLLQPDAFTSEVSRRVSRSPSPIVSEDIFLSQADELIQVTALTTFSVRQGKNSPNPGFGIQSTGEELTKEIDKFLKKQFPEIVDPDISNDANKIIAFDNDDVNSSERWEGLSRILDGKKSLMRLCRYLSDSLGIESIRHWEEMRGCLANAIASKDTIDHELKDLMDDIGSRAPN